MSTCLPAAKQMPSPVIILRLPHFSDPKQGHLGKIGGVEIGGGIICACSK